MKKANWIHRIRLFKPDDYQCSACGAAYERPCAVCPGCGRSMRRTKNDPMWIEKPEMIFKDD